MRFMLCITGIITVVAASFIDDQRYTFYSQPCYNRVSCIEGDFLWIATDDCQVVRLDTRNGEQVFYNPLNANLIDDDCNEIIVDKNGNKWFLTLYGIAKFDGKQWSIYNKLNSGFVEWPNDVAADSSGAIWFATRKGLLIYDGQEWIPMDTSNSEIPFNDVNTIIFDTKGNAWIADYKRLSRYDGKTWTEFIVDTTGVTKFFIYDLAGDANDNIWLRTGQDILKFDGASWTAYKASDAGITNESVYDFTVTQNGTVWMLFYTRIACLRNGVWSVDSLEEPVKQFTKNLLSPGLDNSVWYCTNKQEMINISRNAKKSYPIQRKELLNGYIDFRKIKLENSSKWFATTSSGLLSWNGVQWNRYDSSNSPIRLNNVEILEIDMNYNKWVYVPVSETVRTIFRFDGKKWEELSGIPGNSDRYIKQIAFDRNNDLWLVSSMPVGNDCLLHFNGQVWKEFAPGDTVDTLNYQITSLAFDTDNSKWVVYSTSPSYETRLYNLRNDEWKYYDLQNFNIPYPGIRCAAVDPQGVKWFGTAIGLLRFDNSAWQSFRVGNVVKIFFDGYGNLWGADTRSGPGSGHNEKLFRFRNGELINYDGSGNFPLTYSTVYDAAPDTGGNVWAVIPNHGSIPRTQRIVEFKRENPLQIDHECVGKKKTFSALKTAPNPFTVKTAVSFSIPRKQLLVVDVCNIRGQLIRSLCRETRNEGLHTLVWDGNNAHGAAVSTGVYFIRMRIGDSCQLVKVIRK